MAAVRVMQLLLVVLFIGKASSYLPLDWHAQIDPDPDSAFSLKRLDHYVITVEDMNKTVDFYTRVLGMEAEQLGARIALHFGESKINVHQRGNEVGPTASVVLPGTSDVCLVTDSDIDTVVRHFKKMDVPVVAGPWHVSGALGTVHSVYVNDPDKNLIEIATYNFK